MDRISSPQASVQTLNSPAAKARSAATEFEAQFLKVMLEQAYAGVSGEGPLGGGGIGAEAWRSFLIDEHAKAMAASGGIGVAALVYRDMQKSGAF